MEVTMVCLGQYVELLAVVITDPNGGTDCVEPILYGVISFSAKVQGDGQDLVQPQGDDESDLISQERLCPL